MQANTLRITYLNTSSFAVYLIPAAWRYYKNGGRSSRGRSSSTASYASYGGAYTPIPDDEPMQQRERLELEVETVPVMFPLTRSVSPSSPRASLAPLADDSLYTEPAGDAGPLPKLTIRETAVVAAWWSAVWFLANWSLNASLAWASVASVTILSSTTSEYEREEIIR
jgi:solute carrier family 35 protein F5